jgi:serine/threonine-protein kinase
MVNVVGSSYESAVEQLEGLGLDTEDNIVVSYEENDDYEDGTVIYQSVAEGEAFSLKDTLRLTVTGEDSAESGSTDTSTDASSNSGTDSSSSSNSSGNSSSSNSSSSSSSSGSSSKENSSSSTDTKTDSDSTVAVPSVVGLTQAEATTVLDAKGIVVTSTTQEYSDEVTSGSVISQSIEAGEMVAPNTSISLVISKGKKETTYSYTVSNPFDGPCTYSIAETNQSGNIPKNGAINISKSPKSSLTITLTYTPTITASDGSTVALEDQTQTKTETINGTVEQ